MYLYGYLPKQMSWRSPRELASICHFLYFKGEINDGWTELSLILGDKAQVFPFQHFALRFPFLEEARAFGFSLIF